jgi:DNA-binding MarR family transcriptional regulator
VPDSDAELLETLLARVMRLVSVHLDAPVSDVAGTPLSAAESSLLVELQADGAVTQQQLADRLSIDKSRVSRLCAALDRKGLLDRERDASNRRNLRLALTGSGRAAATRLRQAWRAYHEQMLAAMTPGERQALLVGLTAFARELAVVHAQQRPYPGAEASETAGPLVRAGSRGRGRSARPGESPAGRQGRQASPGDRASAG